MLFLCSFCALQPLNVLKRPCNSASFIASSITLPPASLSLALASSSLAVASLSLAISRRAFHIANSSWVIPYVAKGPVSNTQGGVVRGITLRVSLTRPQKPLKASFYAPFSPFLCSFYALFSPFLCLLGLVDELLDVREHDCPVLPRPLDAHAVVF